MPSCVDKIERKTPAFGTYAEPSLLILVSLSDGAKHGYAIMQDVERTSRPMGRETSTQRSRDALHRWRWKQGHDLIRAGKPVITKRGCRSMAMRPDGTQCLGQQGKGST
jgi:hypothetical protein